MAQTQMPLYMGLAPGLNSTQQIDAISFRMNVVQKAAAYTVLATESGTVFTTGAAVTFTLPDPADGLVYWFICSNAAAMTVTAAAANIFILFNDLTATSIAFSTGGEIIGSGVMVVSDGTYWYGFVHLAAESVTPTIA